MGFADSIRTHLTPSSMLNEIRLLLSVPQNKQKTIVLVEGQDDIKLLLPLIDTRNNYLIESYYGKSAIVEVLSSHLKNDNRVIGIIDKDYNNISLDKIFTYDHCNAEMMEAGQDAAFSLTIFQITDKWLDIKLLRNCVLTKLLYISAIRKLNEENDWGLSFQGLPINSLMGKSGSEQLSQIIKILNIKNSLNIIDEKRQRIIIEEVENLKRHNLLDYTNGHDFCTALLRELKFMFPKVKKVTSINSDEMATFLRMGFRKEHFITTELYKDLKKYQGQYNLNIL